MDINETDEHEGVNKLQEYLEERLLWGKNLYTTSSSIVDNTKLVNTVEYTLFNVVDKRSK